MYVQKNQPGILKRLIWQQHVIQTVNPTHCSGYHSRSEGGIVFSSVCLYVCLSVNAITRKPLDIWSWSHPWTQGRTRKRINMTFVWESESPGKNSATFCSEIARNHLSNHSLKIRETVGDT